MPKTEAQKRAQKKYDAKAKRLILRIYPSEQDILDKILEVSADGGYAPYIKRLIREDIERNRERQPCFSFSNDKNRKSRIIGVRLNV